MKSGGAARVALIAVAILVAGWIILRVRQEQSWRTAMRTAIEAERASAVRMGAIELGSASTPPPSGPGRTKRVRVIAFGTSQPDADAAWSGSWAFLATDTPGTVAFEVLDRPLSGSDGLPHDWSERRLTDDAACSIKPAVPSQLLLGAGIGLRIEVSAHRIAAGSAEPPMRFENPAYRSIAVERPMRFVERWTPVSLSKGDLLLPGAPHRSNETRLLPPATPLAAGWAHVEIADGPRWTSDSQSGLRWTDLDPGRWHVIHCATWEPDEPGAARRVVRLEPEGTARLVADGKVSFLSDADHPVWVVRFRFDPESADGGSPPAQRGGR